MAVNLDVSDSMYHDFLDMLCNIMHHTSNNMYQQRTIYQMLIEIVLLHRVVPVQCDLCNCGGCLTTVNSLSHSRNLRVIGKDEKKTRQNNPMDRP